MTDTVEHLMSIPIAIHIFGCCYSGHKEPFKTVEIEADSRYDTGLYEKAFKLLNVSTVEHMCYVGYRPNPRYLEWRSAYRRFHGLPDN